MFNGIWLVAAEPLTIQGREVKTGERFHISRTHSGALLVTGRATIAHPQPPPKSRVTAPPVPPSAPSPRRRRRPQKTEDVSAPAEVERAEVPADPPVIPETTDDQVIESPSRHYHRRDLEADEA